MKIGYLATILLEVLRKRLGSWGNKYISMAMRVVLVNDVLGTISIFFLSFFHEDAYEGVERSGYNSEIVSLGWVKQDG